jgi:CDP-paratose 2-epimerase
MTRKIIITGGAGFIGCNAASRYLRQGHQVIVIDDLSRRGTQRNLDWLRPQGHLEFCERDIRDRDAMDALFQQHADAGLIIHLAGQVAVTTSVADPREDYDINATGSFNVLEAARKARVSCPIIYSSTNKVYGGLENLPVSEGAEQYRFASHPLGVPETQPLDFHSPYGCSKGAADQYFRDYHRIYGLKTVVFRQSCIYGYRQFGIEDQGWVAWFIIAAELGKPITVYGDGKQVRDVLFVEDLIDAYDAAAERIDVAAGQIYNVGGGARNSLSLLQLLSFLREKYGEALRYSRSDWRPGDQRIYVSDIRHVSAELGWAPKTDVARGLEKLQAWVSEHKELFR